MALLRETILAHLVGSAPTYATRHLGLVNVSTLVEASYSGYARQAVSSWSASGTSLSRVWSAQGGPWTFSAVNPSGTYQAAMFEAASGGNYVLVGGGAIALVAGDSYRRDTFTVSLSTFGLGFPNIDPAFMVLLLDHYFNIASFGAPSLYVYNGATFEAMTFTRVGNEAANDSAFTMAANIGAYMVRDGPSLGNRLVATLTGGTPIWTSATVPAGRLRLTIF